MEDEVSEPWFGESLLSWIETSRLSRGGLVGRARPECRDRGEPDRALRWAASRRRRHWWSDCAKELPPCP
eukprot:218693-Prymnesium_polylepis.1